MVDASKSENNITMADEGKKDAVFRFFDLPAELRDWVYDYLIPDEEETIASPEMEASLSVKDFPLTNILLVNREMKAEYEKRAAKKTTLIFSDHENFNFTLLPLPVKVADLTRIEVRMFIVCEDRCPMNTSRCDAANDLRQSMDMIDKIRVQLPVITSLEVNLGLWCKAQDKFEWPNTPHHHDVVEKLYELVQVPKMSRLSLYRSDERSLEANLIVDSERQLASWTPGNGWQAAREAAHAESPK